MRIRKSVALTVVLVLLLGAGTGAAAWFLGPWLRPRVAPGGLTFNINVNLPDVSRMCTLVGVNHTEAPVEGVVLTFSSPGGLMVVSSDTMRGSAKIGGESGEFRPSEPLKPGERVEYATMAAAGPLESVRVGTGDRAKTHAVKAPLAAGKRLVVTFEPDDTVSARTEWPRPSQASKTVRFRRS